jgi:hypothetical protein
MIYYIYHIPNFKWKKTKKLGKIGCTDELKVRMRKQGATEYEILETHSDIYIASDREIELQKQYGYPVDNKPYWRAIKMVTKESASKGGLIGGKIAGKIIGKRNVESGHIDIIKTLGAKARSIAISQYDKNNNFIRDWDSARQAARELNLHQPAITRVCKGKQKYCGVFVFRYKEQTHC